MSHHREAFVYALYGFIFTMIVSVPLIFAAHLKKADRIEAYERPFSSADDARSIRTS